MPAADGQGPIFLTATDQALPDPLPEGIAKYSRFHEMARGGTGMLRTCFDEITGRTVVMKSLLPEHVADETENRRLLREARVTALLQHPNTVPVYEIGRTDDIGLYFTMKRISGENLFQVLKRVATNDERTIADFPLKRRVEVVANAALALMYSHARGVIHRDVKPENIWVGNFGEVILLDWGVAKVWGQPSDAPQKPTSRHHREPLQNLTMAGDRPGTPLYMSPEQVSVNRSMVDERSDIFSTGIVLYEAAALWEPFRGRVIKETFDNILYDTPKLPSERRPQDHIPPQLDEIVMRAIKKRPAERYQTMREMLEDIRNIPFED